MKNKPENIWDERFITILLDSLADGVFALDEAGKIVSWNKSMERITGYTAEEALGKKCSILNFSRCFQNDCPRNAEECEIYRVGSMEAKECLLIQLRHLDIDDPIVIDVLENHLNHIENKNYKAVSKALKISLEDTIAAVDIIKALEPRPGRQFSEEEPQYIYPDIFVYKFENDFVITLNDDGMPKLRINSFYKQSMANNNIN